MILGINTDHRYKGKTFHIQTEDSGLQNPVLITHVFIGGSIIASRKSDYADALERDDLEEHVRGLMRAQHRATLEALMAGEFDEATKGTSARKLGDIPLARDKRRAANLSPEVSPVPTTPPSRATSKGAPLLPPVSPSLPPRPAVGDEDDVAILSSVDLVMLDEEGATMEASLAAADPDSCPFPTDLLAGLPLSTVVLAHLLDDE